MGLQLRKKGFTTKGKIDFQGVHGIYGALEFEYRPVMPDEFDAIREEVGKSGRKGCEAIAANMHTRITAWNVESDSGEPVPVTKESMLEMLPPVFIEQLYNIVMGYSISGLEKN